MRLHRTRWASCLLLLFAIASPGSTSGQPRIPAERFFSPAVLNTTYVCGAFPLGRRRNPVVSELIRDHLANHWNAAAEPSLFEKSRGEARPSWRMTFVPAFANPVIVRIDETRAGMRLYAVRLSGPHGDEPGTVAARIERDLTVREQRSVRRAVATIGGLSPQSCRRGYDGETWTWEESAPGRYRLVERWTPMAGHFHDLGSLFMDLTKDQLGPQRVPGR